MQLTAFADRTAWKSTFRDFGSWVELRDSLQSDLGVRIADQMIAGRTPARGEFDGINRDIYDRENWNFLANEMNNQLATGTSAAQERVIDLWEDIFKTAPELAPNDVISGTSKHHPYSTVVGCNVDRNNIRIGDGVTLTINYQVMPRDRGLVTILSPIVNGEPVDILTTAENPPIEVPLSFDSPGTYEIAAAGFVSGANTDNPTCEQLRHLAEQFSPGILSEFAGTNGELSQSEFFDAVQAASDGDISRIEFSILHSAFYEGCSATGPTSYQPTPDVTCGTVEVASATEPTPSPEPDESTLSVELQQANELDQTSGEAIFTVTNTVESGSGETLTATVETTLNGQVEGVKNVTAAPGETERGSEFLSGLTTGDNEVCVQLR